MKFSDKIIWITGASSGIGRELAVQLAARGARIVLSSRRAELLELLRNELPGGAQRHWVVALDLSNSEVVMAKAAVFVQQHGPIDILINNGGISQRSLLLETDFAVYRHLMEVNYLGTVALTKAVLPGMVELGSGTVVSISSVAGKVSSKLRTGYSGSKYAVIGFMDCLRAELKQHGVACLTVCPGSIQTDIALNALDSSGRAQQKNDASIESGMAVEQCCEQIIKAISSHKEEVVIGKGISAWAPLIRRFFPALFNYFTARSEYR